MNTTGSVSPRFTKKGMQTGPGGEQLNYCNIGLGQMAVAFAPITVIRTIL
jgi:hypothetical protein